MQKIRLLDEATVNKIAAGEVIERPASVVKELIENSIDAGASEIRVEIKKGGKELIRVTDNGCGMSKEDASVSFLKHATSKINTISDIENVGTMGFRGEALSSIAAVSKMEIITKTGEELSGTKIIVHGSKTVSITETGTASGTTITAEELFYNTPARKKYLKSDSTELAHITDIITKNAIGHNNITFTLNHNGREIIKSPAGDVYDTLIHIYGQDVARSMVPVHIESGVAQVTGYISKPVVTRGNLDYQSIFINDRSVTSREISFALRRGYGTLLPKGRFPVAVLKITVDRNEVDVNVHPTKNQVRLSHEREIANTVASAVRRGLYGKNLIPEASIEPVQTLISNVPETQLVREQSPGLKVPVKDTERRLRRTEQQDDGKPAPDIPELKVLGQVESVYVITETGDGLTIIDQHAAHERILFEQVRDSRRTDSQELIVPVNLELDPKERTLMKECIPYLEEFGFRISEFGPDSFAITAVPDVLGKLEDTELVHDIIIDILKEGKIKEGTGIFDRVTKSVACRGAIKAGADCSPDQMKNLISQLLKTENPYTCPHGRPTMVTLNRQELDKLFKRA